MLNKSEQKRKTAKAECLKFITDEPKSIKAIALHLRINWRTCYRLMADLKADGHSIETTKDYLYYIANNNQTN